MPQALLVTNGHDSLNVGVGVITYASVALSNGDSIVFIPSGNNPFANGTLFTQTITKNGLQITDEMMLLTTSITVNVTSGTLDNITLGSRFDENSFIVNETYRAITITNSGLVTVPFSMNQPPAPPALPAPYWTTLTPEQLVIYDKQKLAQIIADLKANVQVIDDDSIFYTIGGNSSKAALVMELLDNGGGYVDLVALNTANALGLSDTIIMRIMAIYLVKVDTIRYQNEAGLALITSYARLQSFMVFLAANNIEVPSLEPNISVLRSNIDTFNAARFWAATNPV